ncbi:uncharacterized protein [Diadema setosum]|uniref:uncharacterized protein n=1 Tax=Diadema setosum TaxID=31175 RepID=UPI003B3B72AC
MNEVMKNAQIFLDLIQAAKTQTAQKWNRQALQRAIQWAEYFETVHKKLSTKPAAVTQFSKGLCIIHAQPRAAPGPNPTTFEQLSQSRRLLLKILLQNPFISSELYSLVLDQYNHLPPLPDGTTGMDMLNEDASECAHTIAVKETLLKMKELTSETVERVKTGSSNLRECSVPTESFYDMEMKVDATIFHEHFHHHLSQTCSFESTKEYLSDKLHEVAANPSGLEVISHSSLCGNSGKTDERTDMTSRGDDQKKMTTSCKHFIDEWLNANMTKYEVHHITKTSR